MRTRRQNILMYNDWMKECVRLLGRSPLDVDRRFARWFDLQKITDETMASFGLDDTSSTAPLTEARVHTVLRWFDKRMEDWKEDTIPEMLTGKSLQTYNSNESRLTRYAVPMILEYHYTILAVYEVAIGEGYRDPDAIKQQYYTLPAPDEDKVQKQLTEPLSAVRVDITLKWLNAAHGLLDAFLSCDIPNIRKMPNQTYSRAVLGIMVLLKIFFSVKCGALGEVISSETVNVDMYLETMTQRLTDASAGSKFAIPTRWLRVVGGKARDWYDRFQLHHARKEAQLQELQAQLNAHKPVNTPVDVHLPSSASSTWHGIAVSTDRTTGGVPQPILRTEDFSLRQGGQVSPFEHVSASSSGGFNTPGSVAPARWFPSNEGVYSINQQTGYLIRAETTWAQPMSSFPNPSFPIALGQNNDLYPVDPPLEMEWDWVPEGGMFQLPSF
jgi:hypothetical protein